MKDETVSARRLKRSALALGVLYLAAMATPASSEEADPEWSRFEFDYEDGRYALLIPSDLKDNEGIRGVIKSDGRGDYGRLVHRNRMACVNSYGKRGPEGPDLEFLKAAAKASGRKEIAHAGAFVQGLSARGRAAARWGEANADRCIAVVAHHSFVGSLPDMQLRQVPGAAMFLNSSKKDTYQGHNRRRLHYGWTTSDYPCTQSIYYEPTGHGLNGYSFDLILLWLDEVIALRVPPAALIPRDGSSYDLIPIDSRQVGGGVACDLVKAKPEEGGDIHTNVQIGPLHSFGKSGKARQKFWMPGPRSAKLFVEWVKRNHGTVVRDHSYKITNIPSFAPSDMKGFNAKLIAYLRRKMYGNAFTAIESEEKKAAKSELTDRETIIKDILKEYLLAQEAELVERLSRCKEAGDYYLLDKLIKDNRTSFRKMPKYEAFASSVKDLLSDIKTRALISRGRQLAKLTAYVRLSEGRTRESYIKKLDSFAEKNADNYYGKEAKRLRESLAR